jgi:hypothetical protein
MTLLLASLPVGLAVAWLAAEFQPRRWPRLLLGAGTLVSGVALAAVASHDRPRPGGYDARAGQELVEETLRELQAGHAERVGAGLEQLRGEFRPAYASQAEFDGLLDGYVGRLRSVGQVAGQLEPVVRAYVTRTKGWARADYRVRYTGRREAGNCVVDVIHRDDERPGAMRGGGNSVELHIDPGRNEVVMELHFQ